MARKCPKCGKEWSVEHSFCPKDGRRLAAHTHPNWEKVFSEDQGVPWTADAVRPKRDAKRPKVGDKLGPYRLKQLLGIGGMGTVYRAVHEGLDRTVALKILNREFWDHTEVLTRFIKEAQAVNKIRHPNIVDVSDFVTGDDHPPYLVMEFLRGESLSTRLYKRGPVNAKTALHIAHQVVDAMAAVHAQGILHRDLKPDNIHVLTDSPDPERPKIKLLDFGIAKFLMEDDGARLTATGQTVGTPEYMAPEQIEDTKVDFRADVYSVGMILYEMLTGGVPFSHESLVEVMRMQVEDSPDPPSKRLEGAGGQSLPSSIDDLVLACLAKDPDDRVQTMEQLKGILEFSGDTNTALVKVLRHSAPRKKRPSWPIWAAAIVVLLAGGIGAAVALGLGPFGPAGEGSARPGKKRTRAPMKPAPAMAALVEKAPRQVQIVSVPKGALVFRSDDGRFVGRTPRWIDIEPGASKRLTLRRDGFRPRKIRIDHKTTSPLSVTLVAEEKTAAVADAMKAMVAPAPPRRVVPRTRPRARARPRATMLRRRRMHRTGTVDPFR